MKMKIMRIVAATLLFYLTASLTIAQKIETQSSISCEIVVPKELHFVNGSVEGKLRLTNISQETVRVCVMYQEWRTVGGDKFSVVLRPDSWKSDAPSPEAIAKHCVSLKTSEQVLLPFHIIETTSGTLNISARYEIGRQFAIKYKTWSGSVSAKPVVLRVQR
jgi:hypothetical protein